MKKTYYDRKLMMDYLLGKLHPGNQEQFEERYFCDDKIFGQLLTVYDELIEKYYSKQLSEDNSKLFEKKYLQSKRGFERIEFERTLMENISAIKKEPYIRTRLLAASHKLRQWFGEKTSIRIWRLAASGIAIVFIALIARFWLFQPTAYERSLVGEIRFVYQLSDFGFAERETKLKTRGITPKSPVESKLVLTELDRYAVEIQPEFKIFLYVFQWDAHGNMSVLFPNPEYADFENPLMPGEIYRFPPAPKWLSLDETAGVETIGLGGSTRRWEAMENRIRLLSEGNEREKQGAMAEIKVLIAEAEKSKKEEYYGNRFSFDHMLKGGK